MGIKGSSRHLRKVMTPPETLLWQRLKNRQLGGFKIRRQHPIAYNYITDFYCAEKKMIIEIDGSVHLDKEVQINDKYRESYLILSGYHVIRFTNQKVMQDIEAVLVSILEFLKSLPDMEN